MHEPTFLEIKMNFKAQSLLLILIITTVSVLGGRTLAAQNMQKSMEQDKARWFDVATRLDDAFDAGRLPNLHSVLVFQDNQLLLERYYTGFDESRGMPLGEVTFERGTSRDLRSVSKSIVSLLYGIALGEEKVADVDQSILDQFPEYSNLQAVSGLQNITVEHALTMTMGLEWDEFSLPFTDPRNSETAMDLADDRIRFILSRSIVNKPGDLWVYSGGSTTLLADLISRGSGFSIDEYASQKLFEPLGITDVSWHRDLKGNPIAASGLRMRPFDLAKIGLMVMNDGVWEGRRIVPADWLKQSFTVRVQADQYLKYGYQWWLGKRRTSDQSFAMAMGNGGQRLVIIPEQKLVIVITAGNYNKPDQWKMPLKVMNTFILPHVSDS